MSHELRIMHQAQGSGPVLSGFRGEKFIGHLLQSDAQVIQMDERMGMATSL
jgi:hypothetical protein